MTRSARSAPPSPAVEQLASALTDRDAADPLSMELAGWMAASPRFRTFGEAHRDKIRKKLRGASDEEARRDVRAELQAAHLLLADRRIDVAFEAYGSGRLGPDFTVGFRGERSFNAEVTRLRRAPDEAGIGGLLLTKLRQLPPGVPNALLVALDGEAADAVDVGAVVRALRSRADHKDEAFFGDRGFQGTRGFYDRFLRLGAVLAWCEGGVGDARASLWTNRSSRIALPGRAARACLACLRAG